MRSMTLVAPSFPDQVFEGIATAFRKLGYHTYAKVLNAADYGIAHNRCRIFLVAIRKDSLARPFEWPEKTVAKPKISDLLDPPTKDDRAGRLPKLPRSKMLCTEAFNAALEQGVNPLRSPVAVDIDCSKSYKSYGVASIACLTATRGASGGPWISTRGRRTTLNELFRIQGVDPTEVPYQAAGVSQREMGRMLGNSMSVNVCTRVIAEAFWAAGLSAQKLKY